MRGGNRLRDRQGGHPGQQDDRPDDLAGPQPLRGQRHGQNERDQQVSGQHGLVDGQDQVTDHPGGYQVPGHHGGQAGQPGAVAQQAQHQPGLQQASLRRLLRRLLLQDEAGADEDRRHHPEHILHRGRLPSPGRSCARPPDRGAAGLTPPALPRVVQQRPQHPENASGQRAA
jgi:hypothetical protein